MHNQAFLYKSIQITFINQHLHKDLPEEIPLQLWFLKVNSDPRDIKGPSEQSDCLEMKLSCKCHTSRNQKKLNTYIGKSFLNYFFTVLFLLFYYTYSSFLLILF